MEGGTRRTNLDTEVWCSLSNEAERRTNMNLHDDVKGVVRCCVQHLVEGESGIVYNMVDLAVFAALRKHSDLFSHDPTENWGGESTHATVASTIFLGKSSAPTSPATERESPPAALISASTDSRRLASMLPETRKGYLREQFCLPAYSLMTTLAPSLAKRRAQERPIPWIEVRTRSGRGLCNSACKSLPDQHLGEKSKVDMDQHTVEQIFRIFSSLSRNLVFHRTITLTRRRTSSRVPRSRRQKPCWSRRLTSDDRNLPVQQTASISVCDVS